MNRAFAYVRKSKEDKDDPKWSIPTQIERVRESAVRRGEEFAGAFEDRDVSGALAFAERPGWAALEAQLQPGDVIIVNDLSRFARDTQMAKAKLADLAARNVEVVALGIEGIDRKSADGRMLLGIFLEFTEWQRQKTIENLLQVHKRIHVEGKALGCRPPLGYNYNATSKEFEINDNEAEIVQRIYTLKISGYGLQAIARRLRLEGVPTKRGGSWRAQTIRKVLNNERYCGMRTYQGVTNTLHTATIIDKETWELTQVTMNGKAHAPRREYALSGLLTCGICGGIMYRSQLKVGADWRCANMMKGDGCKGVNIREGIAEPEITRQFFDALDKEKYRNTLNSRQKTAQTCDKRGELLARRLSAVERRQSKLMDEYAKDDSALTRDAFNRKMTQLNNEVKELESARQDLQAESTLARRPVKLENIEEAWELLDPIARREALRIFIQHVNVMPSRGKRGASRLHVQWRYTTI